MIEKHITLEIHAKRQELKVIKAEIEKAAKKRNLSLNNWFQTPAKILKGAVISILPYEERFCDHGQNPVGDPDLRPYLKITGRTGALHEEQIYNEEGSDVSSRFILRDIGRVIGSAFEAIQSYLGDNKT
jgi:hypothetical protein